MGQGRILKFSAALFLAVSVSVTSTVCALSLVPWTIRIRADESFATDRRNIIRKSSQIASSILFLQTYPVPAYASNLPSSTGADTSQTGTVKALVPIVDLRNSLLAIDKQLQRGEFPTITSIPTTDKEFKRLFDAYSDKVSYKQKFLDQNAFLVYYSKGFDGNGRPNIEEDINERQTIQYGLRNEAWINWNNFLVELQFVEDSDNDLVKYLQATIQAVNEYLTLVPQDDLVQVATKK